jgi:hypothetical protein
VGDNFSVKALSDALTRIQRLSAVEAEQGKVDWYILI